MGWAPTSSLIGVLRSFWSLGSPTRPWLLGTTSALKGPCIHLASNYLWMRLRGLINPSKKVLEPLPLRRLWIEPWKMSALFGLLPHWFNFIWLRNLYIYEKPLLLVETGIVLLCVMQITFEHLWKILLVLCLLLVLVFLVVVVVLPSIFFLGRGEGAGFSSNILGFKGGATPKKFIMKRGSSYSTGASIQIPPATNFFPIRNSAPKVRKIHIFA